MEETNAIAPDAAPDSIDSRLGDCGGSALAAASNEASFYAPSPYEHVSGLQLAKECRVEPMALRLRRQKRAAEAEVARLDEALRLLDRNPDMGRLLTLLNR